jgi:hypothetical protein
MSFGIDRPVVYGTLYIINQAFKDNSSGGVEIVQCLPRIAQVLITTSGSPYWSFFPWHVRDEAR